MRTPRAFTLLEMLIVLALLAALSALVLPALAGRIGAATASAAAEELGAAAGMARARAVARGRAVALVAAMNARPDGDGEPGHAVRAVRLFADELERHSIASSDAVDRAATTETVLSAAAELLAELPRGCVAGHSAPMADEATDRSDAAVDGAGDAPSIVQLAVFLPDGSPLRPQPVYLRAPAGMAYRLDLGASSGRATVTLLDLTADAMRNGNDAGTEVPPQTPAGRPR